MLIGQKQREEPGQGSHAEEGRHGWLLPECREGILHIDFKASLSHKRFSQTVHIPRLSLFGIPPLCNVCSRDAAETV